MQFDAFFVGGIVFGIFSLGLYWLAAGVFHPAGLVPETAQEAAQLFLPYLGWFSYVLFYAGFFSAVFTTLAGTNILLMTCLYDFLRVKKIGSIDWRPVLENRNFRTALFVSLFVVGGLGGILGNEAILPALIWSLNLLTIATPPGLAIWIYFTNSQKYVNGMRNSWYWNIGLIAMLIAILYIAALALPGIFRNPFSST